MVAAPNVTLPVVSTSDTRYPEGGTNRSAAPTAFPAGVSTVTLPDIAPGGTVVEMEVAVAELTSLRFGRYRRKSYKGVGEPVRISPVMWAADAR